MSARTVLSAGLAAALLAADAVILTLFLNPERQLSHEAPGLLVSLFLPYLLLGTLAFLAVAGLASITPGLPRARPSVEGLPWATGLALLALTAAAGLFGLNLLSYRYSLPVETVRGLAASAVGLTLAALVLVAVVVDAVAFPGRTRGLSAALVVLAAASAVVVPLALRPRVVARPRPVPLATEPVQPVRRVVLVGVDGLGPDMVQQGIERGQLPALARMARRGAQGPLATFRPAEGPPIWTTILTGRLPRDHGVKAFTSYRLAGSTSTYELLPKGALVGPLTRTGLVSAVPAGAGSRRCRTLWNVLNAFGIQTGMVRLWGTHPAEHVQGFMLSHYFHVLRHDPTRVRESLYPPDLLAEVVARGVEPAEVDPALLSRFVDLSAAGPRDSQAWRRDLVERALAPDLTYLRAGDVLRAAYDPPFFATYVYGLDVVGHSFLRYARPDEFGDVPAADQRRFGSVLTGYTGWLSERIGLMAQALRPGEVLLVVSGYGMEPMPLWRRVVAGAVGGSSMSGTHARAPDGVFLAVGDGIRAGAILRGGSVLDVAPTILYLMGLPVARDMDGRVLTEILEPEFARDHPVTFIPSYESLAVAPTAAPIDSGLPPLPEEGS